MKKKLNEEFPNLETKPITQSLFKEQDKKIDNTKKNSPDFDTNEQS